MNMNNFDANPKATHATDAAQQTTEVAIFGPNDGTNDFPVLKAFQEYIDAEQAKARKRMIGLSVFFIVLLVVVVATFTLIMTAFITRNQALSDKLLDIALKERPQTQAPMPPVVAVQPTLPAPAQQSSEIALKPVLEQIEKLTEAVAKSQRQTPPAPVVVTAAPAPQPVAVTLPPAESAETVRLREELRKQQEALKAEQQKLKEAIHQAEVEKHRRRLYPDYYARLDARRQSIEAPDEAKIKIQEGHPTPLPRTSAIVTPSPAVAQTSNKKPEPPPSTGASKAKNSKPVNYFEHEGEDEELKDLLRKAKVSASPVPVVEQKKVQKTPTDAATNKPMATKPSTQSSQPQVKSPAPVKQSSPSVAKVATKPEVKTETISVGQGGTNAIPWLIEVPETK